MMKIMTPWRVVKMQNIHSIMEAMVVSPTTKNPSTQVMPRMGTRTKEAWTRVLWGGGYNHQGVVREGIIIRG